MKTLLIYFSQTGNTRTIAESIRRGILDVTNHCDIRTIDNIEAKSLFGYDLIGIGSPVFFYKEPFNVRDFIEALPEQDGRHWFIFCTHGNIVGNFFPSMIQLLEEKGATVIACHNSYANITVPFYPRPSYTSGHPDAYDLEQAQAFGKNIAMLSSEIRNQGNLPISLTYPVSSEEWLEEGKRLTREVLKEMLPKHHFNAETCIQCYECEDHCPVQGIDIKIDPPRLQEPCIYCWRCINICPTLSITADWGPLLAMAPTNYLRYKKELDKVAKNGKFRWLVDPETIDCTDPLYKQRERDIDS